MKPKLRLGAVVLDCPDSEALARFYAALLGGKVQRYDEEWVLVLCPPGPPMVFQQVEEYQPPVWPSRPGCQQQMAHVDLYTNNVAKGVAFALECGATLHETQLDESWRVLLDPAGHPFCILPNTPPA